MDGGNKVKFATDAGFGRKIQLDADRKVALHRGCTPEGKIMWLTMGEIGDCETAIVWSDEAFAGLVQMYFELTIKAETMAAEPEWLNISEPA